MVAAYDDARGWVPQPGPAPQPGEIRPSRDGHTRAGHGGGRHHREQDDGDVSSVDLNEGVTDTAGTVEDFLDSAQRLRWRAPELAFLLAERAVASAEPDDPLYPRAVEMLLYSGNRIGRGVDCVRRGILALHTLRRTDDRLLACQVRVELAHAARAARAGEIGTVLLEPVLCDPECPDQLRATALIEAAAARRRPDQQAEASAHLVEAEGICRTVARSAGQADIALLTRGALRVVAAAHYRRAGDFHTAYQLAVEGSELVEGLSADMDPGQVRGGLIYEMVCAALDLGRVQAAVEAATTLWRLPPRRTMTPAVGWTNLVLATRHYLPSGKMDRARELIRETCGLAEHGGHDEISGAGLSALACLYEADGDLVSALRCLRGAFTAERRWHQLCCEARASLTIECAGVSADHALTPKGGRMTEDHMTDNAGRFPRWKPDDTVTGRLDLTEPHSPRMSVTPAIHAPDQPGPLTSAPPVPPPPAGDRVREVEAQDGPLTPPDTPIRDAIPPRGDSIQPEPAPEALGPLDLQVRAMEPRTDRISIAAVISQADDSGPSSTPAFVPQAEPEEDETHEVASSAVPESIVVDVSPVISDHVATGNHLPPGDLMPSTADSPTASADDQSSSGSAEARSFDITEQSPDIGPPPPTDPPASLTPDDQQRPSEGSPAEERQRTPDAVQAPLVVAERDLRVEDQWQRLDPSESRIVIDELDQVVTDESAIEPLTPPEEPAGDSVSETSSMSLRRRLWTPPEVMAAREPAVRVDAVQTGLEIPTQDVDPGTEENASGWRDALLADAETNWAEVSSGLRAGGDHVDHETGELIRGGLPIRYASGVRESESDQADDAGAVDDPAASVTGDHGPPPVEQFVSTAMTDIGPTDPGEDANLTTDPMIPPAVESSADPVRPPWAGLLAAAGDIPFRVDMDLVGPVADVDTSVPDAASGAGDESRTDPLAVESAPPVSDRPMVEDTDPLDTRTGRQTDDAAASEAIRHEPDPVRKTIEPLDRLAATLLRPDDEVYGVSVGEVHESHDRSQPLEPADSASAGASESPSVTGDSFDTSHHAGRADAPRATCADEIDWLSNPIGDAPASYRITGAIAASDGSPVSINSSTDDVTGDLSGVRTGGELNPPASEELRSISRPGHRSHEPVTERRPTARPAEFAISHDFGARVVGLGEALASRGHTNPTGLPRPMTAPTQDRVTDPSHAGSSPSADAAVISRGAVEHAIASMDTDPAVITNPVGLAGWPSGHDADSDTVRLRLVPNPSADQGHGSRRPVVDDQAIHQPPSPTRRGDTSPPVDPSESAPRGPGAHRLAEPLGRSARSGTLGGRRGPEAEPNPATAASATRSEFDSGRRSANNPSRERSGRRRHRAPEEDSEPSREQDPREDGLAPSMVEPTNNVKSSQVSGDQSPADGGELGEPHQRNAVAPPPAEDSTKNHRRADTLWSSTCDSTADPSETAPVSEESPAETAPMVDPDTESGTPARWAPEHLATRSATSVKAVGEDSNAHPTARPEQAPESPDIWSMASVNSYTPSTAQGEPVVEPPLVEPIGEDSGVQPAAPVGEERDVEPVTPGSSTAEESDTQPTVLERSAAEVSSVETPDTRAAAPAEPTMEKPVTAEDVTIGPVPEPLADEPSEPSTVKRTTEDRPGDEPTAEADDPTETVGRGRGLKPSEIRALRRREAAAERKSSDVGLADLLAEALVIYEIARVHDDQLQADPLALDQPTTTAAPTTPARVVSDETSPEAGPSIAEDHTTPGDIPSTQSEQSIFDSPLPPWGLTSDIPQVENPEDVSIGDFPRDRMWIPPSNP